MSNVVEQIVHFQRKLEKYSATNETDKLLYYIHKLKHLNIRVSHLEETGVGRSVNALRQQHRGIVADKAKALVNKWKELLDDDEEEEEEEYELEDDEEIDNQEPDCMMPNDDSKAYAEEKQESDSGGEDDEEEGDGRLQIEEDQDPDNHYVGYSSTDIRTNPDEYQPQSMNYSDSDREEGDDADSYNPLTSQRDYLNQSGLARSEYNPSACNSVDGPKAISSPQWRDTSPGESSDRRNGNSPKASSSKKSSKSDKERSKDRERHKDRGKDKHKESSKSHDKERKKERKEKHRQRDREEKEEKKSHKDKHKDKDRHSDKLKENKYTNDEYKEKVKPDKSDERYIANGFSSPEIEERSYSNKKELRESDKRGMNEKRKVKSDKTSGGGSGDGSSSSFHRKDTNSHRDNNTGNTTKENRLSDGRENDRTSKHTNGREKLSVSSSSGGSSSGGGGGGGGGGSSSKDKDKERRRQEKHHDRDPSNNEKKDRHKKESKEKNLMEDKSKSLKKNKVKKGTKAEEDMGFGAALMGLDSPVKKKKKKKKKEADQERESSDDEKPSTSLSYSKRSLADTGGKSDAKKPKLLYEASQKLPMLPSSIPDDAAFLPEITPNYKPLPRVALRDEVDSSLAKMTDEETLNFMFQSKNKRSKVYSGRVTGLSYLPSLYECCIRVLQDNIDALEATGGIPFDILRPILERADARQLMTLEDYNPYLLRDTNVLWEVHCKRDFRSKKLEEMETWRELWLRCSDERDHKLKSITQSLQKKFVSNSEPKRTTKLAFVDTNIKVPKNVARAQAKYGTAPSSAAAKPGKANEVAARKAAMLNVQRAERAPNPRPTPAKNKKVAPLMAKTRQFYKKAFRR